ncbi:MAG: hypothetical protein QS748_00275 [Candidatus Endonucleobacter bathymodioli]|uniref:Sel1 repeat family protein n=1 Tax=Candidatus Endonucleibacter bathymodioli TaxID=539814 RepID=A0AA90SLF9_9GAMM|nr:hypothetical protein [Candidatus Endonucleobacter bathymodioli]
MVHIKTYFSYALIALLLSSTNSIFCEALEKSPTVKSAVNPSKTILEQITKQLNDKEAKVDLKKSILLLQSLADNGSTEAMLWLGRIYRDVLDESDRDAKKAFSYFKQAGGKEGKNYEAQYELGKAYFYGEGTDRNLISAFLWTSLSLQKNTPVQEKAREQVENLKGMLTDEQLKYAYQLVDNISSLYLSQ